MRYIHKHEPPAEYARWCTPTGDWNPSWAALGDARPIRRRLVDALLAEQSNLCAYCNVRVTAAPGDHHVEHLLPRRLLAPHPPPTAEEQARMERCGIPRDRLDIDHRNLLACCPNKDGKLGRPGCGDHKGSRLLPLTPLEPSCEAAFRYLPTGTIESDMEEGTQTIRVLKLDRPDLTRARKDALEGWLQVVLDIVDTLPPGNQGPHLQRLLDADPLPEFIVAVRQLLRPFVPDDDVP